MNRLTIQGNFTKKAINAKCIIIVDQQIDSKKQANEMRFFFVVVTWSTENVIDEKGL